MRGTKSPSVLVDYAIMDLLVPRKELLHLKAVKLLYLLNLLYFNCVNAYVYLQRVKFKRLNYLHLYLKITDMNMTVTLIEIRVSLHRRYYKVFNADFLIWSQWNRHKGRENNNRVSSGNE